MKKVETTFVCDDCGELLPTNYIRRNGNGEDYFNRGLYNTVQIQVNSDCWIHINVDLDVTVDYGGAYKDLCPKCRIKWLKRALAKFEADSLSGQV